MAFSFFRSWLGRPEHKNALSSHHDEQVLDVQHITLPFFGADGPGAFLSAQSFEQKEHVLNTHPFWRQPDVHLRVDAQLYPLVLDHIHRAHVMEEDLDDPHENTSSRALSWGRPDGYTPWLEQAMVLAQQEPSEASDIFDAVHQQLYFQATKHIPEGDDSLNYWWEKITYFFQHGGSIDPAEILNILCVQEWQLDDIFKRCPVFEEVWKNPTMDKEVLNWVTKSPSQAEWIIKNHPRLSSWELAEQQPTKENIETFSKYTRDGALLKAWHGIALTGEETAQHPLAYSLYVHKHAPIYLEEAVALPPTWSMALTLSTTGVEFRDMLLVAAKAKMEPEHTPEQLNLPELGEIGHAIA